jgi:topoisomerase-4 subunit A
MNNTSTLNGKEEHNNEPIAMSGMYKNWFLDYASYVILERAVPAIEDGLKPVQRRILHAMKEMDDGRFNKVANVIGQTMQYHPHGDASITEAMVNLGQKDLLIETQGNWGDVRTGDSAAAARYIEARLSKFALDVVFNPDTTEWQLSYDGRKREPVTLPVKFPLLLAQGVEGIAVGLSTKILPHNFIELIEGSIDILKGKTPVLYPDFQTGGMMDVADYRDGLRGGKVRVRARIEEVDKKTLAIKDIPFGVTTGSLIDSIVSAGEKGKIKIKKPVGKPSAVEDNTAKDVEILVHLDSGISPDVTIDALYAFTDCEVSISPNACIIINDKPHFSTVTDILRIATENTKELLRRELEIKKAELLEKILYSSLEKIFIENRIYRQIEECETFELVIETVDKGLEPYKSQFYRAITEEDILKLLEIRIKRISKYDAFKADELMKKLQEELLETEDNLANLTRFAINYYKDLLKKYGKGRERKTEIRSFETINITSVAATNAKLYVNKKDGFIGYGLKVKDEGTEFVTDCSDIDEIIVFRRDGKFLVSKIQEKAFVGKDILHAGVFKKNDERTAYNIVYLDGKEGISYVKRFQVQGITRDKEYDLTKGNANSKILYFSANPNAEAEIISITLTPACKARVKQFEYNFFELEIKGRSAQGNILTKYPIKLNGIKLVEKVGSTLGGVDLWFDETVGRLNKDKRGRFLGNFDNGDAILAVYKSGEYEITNYELINRYENIEFLEKFNPETIITAVYFDGLTHFVKRFKIETTTQDKKFLFISETKGSKLVLATTDDQPQVEVAYRKDKSKETEYMEYDLDVIGKLQGWKATGIKLTGHKVVGIKLLTNGSPKPEATEKPKNQTEETENVNVETEDLMLPTSLSDEQTDVEIIEEMEELNPKKNKKTDSQLGLF